MVICENLGNIFFLRNLAAIRALAKHVGYVVIDLNGVLPHIPVIVRKDHFERGPRELRCKDSMGWWRVELRCLPRGRREGRGKCHEHT